jgi:class 3 adenylate cyclase
MWPATAVSWAWTRKERSFNWGAIGKRWSIRRSKNIGAETTGDGLLVEFASVVDAVRCAVEVQRGMSERNVGVSVDKRIEFRFGIHLGDIIIADDDIYGDGVNIAARLEV